MQMEDGCGHKRSSLEGGFARKPFINNHTQAILIAGRSRSPLKLLRCHINDRSTDSHFVIRIRIASSHSNPKITEQDLVMAPQQYIFRLNIAMDKLMVMRKL